MKNGRLSEKVAIVTGAGRGIGQAGAIAFAREKAKVMIADVNEQFINESISILEKENLDVNYFIVDVRKPEEVKKLVENTISWAGKVDILYCNAGITIAKNAEDCTLDEFDDIVAVNVRGPWLCCKYALPYMRKKLSGSIIMGGSINCISTNQLHAAYNVSKGGLLGLTRSIARDYGQFGIRANIICPTYTATPMVEKYFNSLPNPDEARREVNAKHLLGRIATTKDIANSAVFLASDESSFITGQAMVVDGGLTSYFA